MIHPASIAARLLQALPVVCAAALLSAQDPVGRPAPAVPEAAPRAESTPDVDQLIRGLGSESFRDRSKAEKALKALGKSALPALQKAAEEEADPEIQWRARRLVRQIAQNDEGLRPRDDGDVGDAQDQKAPATPRNPFVRRYGFVQPGLPQDVQQRFDELFRGLEQDFGVDVPRARFFDDTFFRDLEQQMEDMQKQFSGAQSSEGRSLSMQMGPDGVKVQVKTKNEKGEEETKTYEAPDMETFQQKYPGVLDGAGFGGGFRFSFPNGGLRTFGQMQPQMRVLSPRNWRQQATPQDQEIEVPQIEVAPPADRRLGVFVKAEVAPDLLEYFGLTGALAVEDVQDGSLAKTLGIEKGDLVTHVAGRAIASTQDVQDALGSIEAGKDVEVKVLRKGVERTLVAPKPTATEEPAPLKKRAAESNEEGRAKRGR